MTKVGTIYSYPGNPRAFKAVIAAKYNGQTVDYPEFKMGVANKNPEFKKKFPLGKVPAFEGVDGFTVYESSAIAYYVASLKKDSSILGKDVKEAALIQQFINVADNEIAPHVGGWLYPLIGLIKYNKENVSKAKELLEIILAALDSYLLTRTYLVSERITLADIALSMSVYLLYKNLFDSEYRKKYVNLTRWFVTCINQPNFKAVAGEFHMCEKPLEYNANAQQPKEDHHNQSKAAPKKAEKKPKAPKPEDLEAIAAAEEKALAKAKNPLDSLPPSSFVMDEWKRFYSNNEEPASCKWFWENFDAEGYSMWRVDYKYNDELAMTFMSCNLVGGFFQRMERARKYAFGSLCVLGTNNNNQISGFFIVRGQEVPLEISDAADYESYEWTKVDPNDGKVQKLFNSYISWDSTIDGKPFADGKIFK